MSAHVLSSLARQQVKSAIEKFRPFGGWVAPPADRRTALSGEAEADVIIAGGGFAGLSTALELTAAGAKVILLEKDFCGFGASGRNAGYLAGGQGVKFAMFLNRLGEERAREIVRFYQEGVTYVEDRIRQHAIDCDYLQTGLIRAAVHPSQEKALRKKMEMGCKFGAPLEFLTSDDLRARGIPPAFLFGIYSSNGGTLHPGKYVMGLRRAAIDAGVRIFEDSALLSYEEGPTIECKTAAGVARAPFLVLATNAYTPQLGLLKSKISPIRVSALETAPLSPEQLERVGWHGREGIMTPHTAMESLRLTVHNTLVLTTKRVDYLYGSRTPNKPDKTAYRALAETLYARFPMLDDLPVQSCWTGFISLARDALPVVGETGARNNILYIAGCNGHGVGTHSLIGRLLAQRIGGTEPPLLAALRHKTPYSPPEPARWIGLRLGLRAADFMDRQVDLKVRKMKGGGGAIPN